MILEGGRAATDALSRRSNVLSLQTISLISHWWLSQQLSLLREDEFVEVHSGITGAPLLGGIAQRGGEILQESESGTGHLKGDV